MGIISLHRLFSSSTLCCTNPVPSDARNLIGTEKLMLLLDLKERDLLAPANPSTAFLKHLVDWHVIADLSTECEHQFVNFGIHGSDFRLSLHEFCACHGERRLDPAYSSTIEIEKDEIDHSQEINLTRMNEQEASGGDPLVLVNPIVDAHFH